MNADGIERLLEQAVEAIKRGNKEHGRDLLLRVTEAEPRNEAAWMWLSVAVDDLEDKLIALENVLAVNPANETARANAKLWRTRLASQRLASVPSSPLSRFAGEGTGVRADREAEPALSRPAEPVEGARGDFGSALEATLDAHLSTSLAIREPAEPPGAPVQEYAPAAPVEPFDDGLDDPYQCVYCGRPTQPSDKRCPRCGKSLLVTRAASPQPSANLRTAIFFVGMLFAVSLFEIVPPLLGSVVANGADARQYQIIFVVVPSVELLLGGFLEWAPAVVVALLSIAIARAGLYLFSIAALFARSTIFYFPVVIFLVLDVLWNVYRLAVGYHGALGAIADIVMALAALPRLFGADSDFEVVKRRITVQADRHLKGGLAFYKAGHEYRKQGMWALAVAQWRRAVGAQPKEVLYYKDLGVGYAQIGRFDRSLRVLEEAARQAPGDREIPQIITLVKAQREKAVGRRE